MCLSLGSPLPQPQLYRGSTVSVPVPVPQLRPHPLSTIPIASLAALHTVLAISFSLQLHAPDSVLTLPLPASLPPACSSSSPTTTTLFSMFFTAFYSVSGRFYAHSYKIASLLRPIEALSLCRSASASVAAYCALPLLVHSAMQLSALHCLLASALFLSLSCLLIHCVPLALCANERARKLPALTYTTENLLRRFYFHFHTLHIAYFSCCFFFLLEFSSYLRGIHFSVYTIFCCLLALLPLLL